ncbi:MAG: FTR1 family protein, partial [Candidatus Thorarchaeota archaeon]
MTTYIDLITPLFLAFREGLEATLVVVIILMYLRKTNQRAYNRYVYIGAITAIFTSMLFAIIFSLFFGGFTGVIEEIFEGATFVISGILIVTLVLWVSKEGPKMRANLEEKVEQSIKREKVFSIAILTFVIIIREGIELVLLLTGSASIGSIDQLTIILGSTMGLGISVILGLLTYYGIRTIDLSKFFKATNIVLIFFAAGLITYGIHELIEAGENSGIDFGFWSEKPFDINPRLSSDGSYPILHENGLIGSVLKA